MKKIKQTEDSSRKQGKPADLTPKDKEGRKSLLTGDLTLTAHREKIKNKGSCEGV